MNFWRIDNFWTERLTTDRRIVLGGYLCNTYIKFPGKLTYLTPDTHKHVCISGYKKY